MISVPFLAFNKTNRRMIFILVCSHVVWGLAVVGLWSFGSILNTFYPALAIFFVVLQLYAAAQLILPALLFSPENRSRGFYLFWGAFLTVLVWLGSKVDVTASWQPVVTTFQSSLLLFVATVAGAALARYVKRLWEIIPVCIVMTMADFLSWLRGPTAAFVDQLDVYYRTLEGPPPFIDMVLVKMALPATAGVMPVFGVSDWIIVVFFAIVARRFGANDNLVGRSGEVLARGGYIGRYFPVSVFALMLALVVAQTTGVFLPALPVVAVVMLGWYGLRFLLQRN